MSFCKARGGLQIVLMRRLCTKSVNEISRRIVGRRSFGTKITPNTKPFMPVLSHHRLIGVHGMSKVGYFGTRCRGMTTKPARPFFGTIRYFLNFAPHHFFAGLALGGLVATIGATLYILDRNGKIDLWGHIETQIEGMDKLFIKTSELEEEDDKHECKEKPDNKLFIPLGLVVPLIGWTLAFLWTSSRAAYRGRVDLMFGNFFHSVTVTLMSTRGAGAHVVQRRLAEKTLADISYDNRYLTAMIKQAAGAASITNPVLKLPASQAKHVLNTLQGHISALNAETRIAADIGAPYREQRYWFALTYAENNLRTLVMSEDFIKSYKAGTCLPKDMFSDHETALTAAVNEVLEMQAELSNAGYKLVDTCDDCERLVEANPVAKFVNSLDETKAMPIVGTVQMVALV
eukprot:m.196025 g.196025  ORF g.196025 m.196025 type:complete len:402 (+) comp32598_c0_seq1:93-1298(+)